MASASDSILKEEVSTSEQSTVTLSGALLDAFPDRATLMRYWESDGSPFVDQRHVSQLKVNCNNIRALDASVTAFVNLTVLDVSNNRIAYISDDFLQLTRLEVFIAKNNLMESSSLPKDFGQMSSLRTVNFGGNCFQDFPVQLTELRNVTKLFIGGNQIKHLPVEIGSMSR